MAITPTRVGTAGSIGSLSSSTTAATITVAVASKHWLVVVVAVSNDGTGGTSPITSVVDSGGVNVYTQRALINYSPGGVAGDGATLGIYTSQITSDVTSGTITVNYSPNTSQQSLAVWRLVPGTGESISFVSADTTGSTGNTATHSATTVSVTSGDLIFGAAAIESNDTPTGDADTTNGSWSAAQSFLADGGTDATSINHVVQSKTVTATGNQSWACTTPGAMDSARSYIIFHPVLTDFAVTDLGNGTSITSTTTVATGATISAAVSTGDWLVALVATANSGTSGAAPTITLADSGGTNVYTQQAKINFTPTAAASDGATLGIYTAPVTADIASGTITATLGTAAGEKAIQVYLVRPPTGETISVTAVDTTGSTGNATSLAAATVSVNSGDVIFGACAVETDDVITGDSDTTNGSWSAVITRLADAGTDPTTMSCVSQWKVVNATGNQSWAATVGTARDSARTYLILGSASAAKSIVPDVGSYTLTGTDATTRRNLPLVPDSGSYALTGTDATLRRNLPLVPDSGVYALTGTDATLTLASPFKTIVADAGSYTLTGTDATLTQLFNKSLAAEVGSYSLTGTDAATTHQWKLDATTAGSYTLTGTDAPTTHQWKLDATTAASYALTGTDVTLRHGFFIAAEVGFYTLTGTDVALRRNLPIVAEAGSYLLIGTDAATTHQWKLDATAAGSYSLLGTDVTLTTAANKMIAAELGSYALTGTDVTLTLASLNKSIVADPSSYLLTGTDAATTHQWKLDATTAGSYSLAGQDASLLHKWVLDATAPGSYSLVGSDANLLHGFKVDATIAGAYALTGTDASTLHRWVLDATIAGVYALTGTDATPVIRTDKFIVAAPGDYLLVGDDVTLTKTTATAYTIAADPGDYLLVGTDVILTYQPTAPPITAPTRGEWPEKERKKRRKQREEQRVENIRAARRARDALRESLTRLYDGGTYAAPIEALEEIQTEALATVNAIARLPDLPLREMQVIEDLIRRIQEVVRQRLLDDMQVEAATQIAQAHLAESIALAGQLYRNTRRDYLARTILLIAE